MSISAASATCRNSKKSSRRTEFQAGNSVQKRTWPLRPLPSVHISAILPARMFRKSMSKTEAEPLSAENAAAGEPTPLAPGQIEELKTRAAKADESWERLLRTTADFDNFKKR